MATPLHDPRCAALERLLTELNPDHLRVLVQPGHCSVDPGRLSAVVAKHGGEVHAIEAAGGRVQVVPYGTVGDRCTMPPVVGRPERSDPLNGPASRCFKTTSPSVRARTAVNAGRSSTSSGFHRSGVKHSPPAAWPDRLRLPYPTRSSPSGPARRMSLAYGAWRMRMGPANHDRFRCRSTPSAGSTSGRTGNRRPARPAGPGSTRQ